MLGRLLLHADTRHPIPINTPCSQPLCPGLRSSVTHDIGSVTDIPQLSNGFNSKEDIDATRQRARMIMYIFVRYYVAFRLLAYR